ncbi:MAG: hypothetical protein JKP98_14840 [Rhodobacteraceae bacterium]|nr:hypothetical protein [Paracoccaceae bacterium]
MPATTDCSASRQRPLHRRAGNDEIFGGEADDLLPGQDDDTADYSGQTAAITLGRLGSVHKAADGSTDTLNGIENVIGALDQANRIDGENSESAEFEVDLELGILKVTVPVNVSPVPLEFRITHFTDVSGTGNSDRLAGSDGNNILEGRGGDDVLVGSFGNDVLAGEANTPASRFPGIGNDTADYSALGVGITLNRFGAVEKGANGSAGTDQLFGIETIVGDASQANAVDGANSSTATFNINLATGLFLIDLDLPEEDETLRIEFTVENFNNVLGTANADIITGSARDDTLDGGSGNDTIEGGIGDDSIIGGDGEDSIVGGDGDDEIDGGGNYDSIDAGAGNDIVRGGNGRDTIYLGTGDDVFQDNGQNNEHGHDTVWGGDGNDTLRAAAATTGWRCGRRLHRGRRAAAATATTPSGAAAATTRFGAMRADALSGGGNDTLRAATAMTGSGAATTTTSSRAMAATTGSAAATATTPSGAAAATTRFGAMAGPTPCRAAAQRYAARRRRR